MLTVSGIGSSAGNSLSDAFYVYSDENHNLIDPKHYKNNEFALQINGRGADSYLSSVPAYRDDHTYIFEITVPSGKVRLAVGDTYAVDNSGQYDVTIGYPSDVQRQAAVVTTSADSGTGSLRDVLNTAQADDVVTFAPGLTAITLTSGDLVLDKNVTIEGPTTGSQTISGGGNSRVFEIGANASVTLSHLSIIDGQAPVGPTGQTGGAGGGILNQGFLTIEDSALLSNRSGAGGAGVDAAHAGGKGGSGGGIENDGDLRIDRTTVSSNAAGNGGPGSDNHPGSSGAGGAGGDGGGINSTGSLEISDSSIISNTAGGGGRGGQGATCFCFGNGGIGGSGGAGGGLSSTGALDVGNSTFVGNSAGNGGGGGDGEGIFTSNGGNGGSGGRGGAIISSGGFTLFSSTIAHNGAGAAGSGGQSGFGGSYGASGGAGLIGGVANDGPMTFGTTIIAGNTGGDHSDIDCDANGNVTSADYNVLQNGQTGCAITRPAGNHDIVADPMLGPLADNGGPTLTEEPQDGAVLADNSASVRSQQRDAAASNVKSPVVNTVPAAFCRGSADQRGYSRPSNNPDYCDSGATQSGSTVRANHAALELTGLEVTQSIQDLRNDVPLIAHKTTYVRAHVRALGFALHHVGARLTAYRNGKELGVFLASNRGHTITAWTRVQREALNDSFYFGALPSDWSYGTVTFKFEVCLDGVCRKTGPTSPITCRDHAPPVDNDCEAQVSFLYGAAPKVKYIQWTFHRDSQEHTTTWQDIAEADSNIRALFPIPSLRGSIGPMQSYDKLFRNNPSQILNGEFTGEQRGEHDQWDKIWGRLQEMRNADHCGGAPPKGCATYYLGVLVDPVLNSHGSYGITGQSPGAPGSFANGTVSAAYDMPDLTGRRNPLWNDGYNSLAHEFGHDLGRLHSPCGTNDHVGPYPISGGLISQAQTGDDAYFGFDTNVVPYITPPSKGDLMGYCVAKWPSWYTYEKLREVIADRYPSSTSQGQASVFRDTAEPSVTNRTGAITPSDVADGSVTGTIMVDGVITPTQGTGALSSIYDIGPPSPPSLPDPGPYTILFEDAQGTQLGSYSFGAVSDAHDGETPTQIPFSVALPRDPRTARITLLSGDQVLYTRSAPTHTPTVTLDSPASGSTLHGAVTLRWSGDDADALPLSYIVQYSPDAGTTWQTLVADLDSNSYDVDTTGLAGTTDGLFRVLATDGFHTTEARSAHTFTIAPNAPHVTIDQPMSGTLFVADQTITLHGQAFDAQDGQVGDAGFTWMADDGTTLGTGPSLSVDASTLPEGTRTITLTATDSAGLASSGAITVEVARMRPTLPAQLSVSQVTPLALNADEGGAAITETIAIRNSGDGALAWSATRDQPWIRFDAEDGRAPSDLTVTVDPSGLAPGQYTGAITITAPGATDGSQQIPVTLDIAPSLEGGTATATATIAATSTSTSTSTSTPTATATATSTSTSTESPTPTSTATSATAPSSTAAPPTGTAMASVTGTSTAVPPTRIDTHGATSTATVNPTSAPTSTGVATNTTMPTLTPPSVAIPTPTPISPLAGAPRPLKNIGGRCRCGLAIRVHTMAHKFVYIRLRMFRGMVPRKVEYQVVARWKSNADGWALGHLPPLPYLPAKLARAIVTVVLQGQGGGKHSVDISFEVRHGYPLRFLPARGAAYSSSTGLTIEDIGRTR